MMALYSLQMYQHFFPQHGRQTMFQHNLQSSKLHRKASTMTLLSLAISTLCLTQPAGAVDATGVVNITASVTTDCSVGTSTLAFGTVSSATIQAGNVDATGTVAITCTTGTNYTVKLDIGAGSGASFASRKMTGGANLLNYSIFNTAGHTTVWGDGTTSTVTVAGTGSGSAQSLNAYGRIFAGQTPNAASYVDTVNVTVSY
jgi:spore coat protein U-like protein